MDPASLTARLKSAALDAGFALVGVCPAAAPAGMERFREWLRRGYAGEMAYLAEREAAYADPGLVLPRARSVVMLAMNYRTAEPATPRASEGRVSRYAWGERDYHDVIRPKLHALAGLVRHLAPGAAARGIVDTAPLFEREFAERAGLGWIGKNTLLLNRTMGSWFFLAALLTDVELAYDEPHETDHCGTCRACLDACPTQAFVEPYVLDARRCISYLTIEQKSLTAERLRPGQGDWLFGCDVCQDVCPWNHRAPLATEPAFAPIAGGNPADVMALLALDDAAFRARFRNTPLWRPGRAGVLASAAIVLGNRPCAEALPALVRALDDAEPRIRAACAWALGEHGQTEGSDAARAALVNRLQSEHDASVTAELKRSLARLAAIL